MNKLIIDGMEYSLEKTTSILHHFNTPMVQYQGNTYYGLAVRCHPPEKPEKNYKILEGQFKDVEPHLWQEEGSELKSCISEGCHIYSVKRLSDGEVFKLGDNCTYGVIQKFTPVEYGMLQVNFANDCGATLESITKKPDRVPLFKTEDGVDLFEGDECWVMNDKYQIFLWVKADKDTYDLYHANTSEKFFSTQETAKSYQANNKPAISMNQLHFLLGRHNIPLSTAAKILQEVSDSSRQ